jgi:hypothetical protein
MFIKTRQAITHETVYLQDFISNLQFFWRRIPVLLNLIVRNRSLRVSKVAGMQVISFNLQKSLKYLSREAPSRRVQCAINGVWLGADQIKCRLPCRF